MVYAELSKNAYIKYYNYYHYNYKHAFIYMYMRFITGNPKKYLK